MTPATFRAIRKSLGDKQSTFAARLGMGNRQIQKYEAGEAVIPRTVELAMMAIEAGLDERLPSLEREREHERRE